MSKNRGTPKSSILIGFSIINHPFWGTTIFGNTHINLLQSKQAGLVFLANGNFCSVLGYEKIIPHLEPAARKCTQLQNVSMFMSKEARFSQEV